MAGFWKKYLCKRGALHGIVSGAAFAALFILTFPDGAKNVPSLQYDIVIFGDSLFGETRDETAIPAQLQALTQKSVYNAAMGGTSAARTETDRRLDYGKGSLSLVGLTRAVMTGDFGPQQASRIRESATEYFPEVVDGLEQVDFSQVEIVLIQHGLNDYHAGVPIDNPENPYDEYSYLGALRKAVLALRRKNPELRIVLVTPTYTWYPAREMTCEEMDMGGGVLADYVEAMQEAAKELELELIDVYQDFLSHDHFRDWERYTKDGVHPNAEVRGRLAEEIAEALRGQDT